MQAQRTRDTSPEVALRRELRRRGHRGYRLDWKLPESRRRADIAWPGRRVAVFVDGCFWHACPVHGTLPRANRAWWEEKLQTNAARDLATNEDLARRGWIVVRVWEHETPEAAAGRVTGALYDSERNGDVRGRESQR